MIYEYLDARLFIAKFGAGIGEFIDPCSLRILPASALSAVGATIVLFGSGRNWFEPRE